MKKQIMKYIRTKHGLLIDLEKQLEKEKEEYNRKYGSFYEISNFKIKQVGDKLVAIPVDEKGHKIPDKKLKRTCFFDIWLDDIAKQADTIEELCDWFIVEGDDNEITYHKTLSSAETDGKDYILESNETYTIYGCVSVKGKGLFYRAKMKGVLPNGEIDWELL